MPLFRTKRNHISPQSWRVGTTYMTPSLLPTDLMTPLPLSPCLETSRTILMPRRLFNNLYQSTSFRLVHQWDKSSTPSPESGVSLVSTPVLSTRSIAQFDSGTKTLSMQLSWKMPKPTWHPTRSSTVSMRTTLQSLSNITRTLPLMMLARSPLTSNFLTNNLTILYL